MYDAHHDALASGKIDLGIRIFKGKTEVAMLQDVPAKGYSSSTMEILGFVTWATLESTHLRRWQLPPAHEAFSLVDLPTGWISTEAERPARAENHKQRTRQIYRLSAIGFIALSVVFGAPNLLSAGFACFAVLFCAMAQGLERVR
jgi:hypothetical protein